MAAGLFAGPSCATVRPSASSPCSRTLPAPPTTPTAGCDCRGGRRVRVGAGLQPRAAHPRLHHLVLPRRQGGWVTGRMEMPWSPPAACRLPPAACFQGAPALPADARRSSHGAHERQAGRSASPSSPDRPFHRPLALCRSSGAPAPLCWTRRPPRRWACRAGGGAAPDVLGAGRQKGGEVIGTSRLGASSAGAVEAEPDQAPASPTNPLPALLDCACRRWAKCWPPRAPSAAAPRLPPPPRHRQQTRSGLACWAEGSAPPAPAWRRQRVRRQKLLRRERRSLASLAHRACVIHTPIASLPGLFHPLIHPTIAAPRPLSSTSPTLPRRPHPPPLRGWLL